MRLDSTAFLSLVVFVSDRIYCLYSAFFCIGQKAWMT